MIQFKSLIKIDDVYIEVQEIVSALQVENLDWEYVEGKILIFYNGKEIFGSEITDDINWFWGFIVDGFDVFLNRVLTRWVPLHRQYIFLSLKLIPIMFILEFHQKQECT